VENVHIINSRFINNTLKGIYIEKLSESTIENCNFKGNGHEHYAGAGIDINAKYTEYSNIMIKGCTFVDNGTESSYGGGILIKERGTGDDSSYSSAPATLTNVTIEGCTFESNPKAIVLGEYGVKNTGPTSVVITNATYIDNSQDVVDYRKLNNCFR
jgi:parallel beta-helix repeat protein